MSFNKFYNKIIYLDMDGVICDFLAQWNLYSKTGMNPKDFNALVGDEDFYEELRKYGEKYWSEMPWMKDGELLYNYLKKYRPIILTTPIKDSEDCRTGKIKWVKKFLQSKTQILFSDKKEDYADSHAILIDDKVSNCNKFVINGGNAIIHTSATETIKQLKNKFGL